MTERCFAQKVVRVRTECALTSNKCIEICNAQDVIRRTDFNAYNTKIDAALKEQMAAKTAARKSAVAAKHGHVWQRESNTLTFDSKPLFVAAMPETVSGQSALGLQMVRESPITYTFPEYYASECTLTWMGTGVSWYNYSSATY